jgi:hypothetical protein
MKNSLEMLKSDLSYPYDTKTGLNAKNGLEIVIVPASARVGSVKMCVKHARFGAKLVEFGAFL